MKINALTMISGVAIASVLGAGLAMAQTAAKPQTPAAPATASSAAAPMHKPMHRKAMVKPDGMPDPIKGPMHAPAFEDIDTNHDGVISKAEFEAFHAAHPMPPHGRGEGIRGRMGGGMGWRFMAMQEMMMMRMHEMHRDGLGAHFDLKAADTDHDGKISWAEFQAAANAHLKERFDHLDKNHDGFVTEDELHGPRGQWGGHGPGEHGRDGRGWGKTDGQNNSPPPPPVDGAAK